MRKVITLFCLSAIVFSIPKVQGGIGPAAASGETPDISPIIAKYRDVIPEYLRAPDNPGP